MRWLVSLLLLVPALASAGTWYTNSRPAGADPETLFATPPQANAIVCGTQSTGQYCAWQSDPVQHAAQFGVQTITYRVTLASYYASDLNVTFTFYKKAAAGGVTSLCTDTYVLPAGLGTTHTFSCLSTSTTFAVGDRFYASVNLPDAATASTSTLSPAQFTITVNCLANGDPCPCDGGCQNADCGTLYSRSGVQTNDLYPCVCSCITCAAATPETSQIPGPTNLACSDIETGSQTRCVWDEIPALWSYTLRRNGTAVYTATTGMPRVYIDTPGSGSVSYDVFAFGGTCSPAAPYAGAGTVYGPTTDLKTQATAASLSVRSKGAVIGIW
jgi:hypothetical protein